MRFILAVNIYLLKVRAFLDFLIETYGSIPYWDELGDHNSAAAKRASL